MFSQLLKGQRRVFLPPVSVFLIPHAELGPKNCWLRADKKLSLSPKLFYNSLPGRLWNEEQISSVWKSESGALLETVNSMIPYPSLQLWKQGPCWHWKNGTTLFLSSFIADKAWSCQIQSGFRRLWYNRRQSPLWPKSTQTTFLPLGLEGAPGSGKPRTESQHWQEGLTAPQMQPYCFLDGSSLHQGPSIRPPSPYQLARCHSHR